MRIGLLADMHANRWALEAVVNDAEGRRIDRWLNLGDVLYGPLAPLETFRLLEQINASTIQGNEDRRVYQATEAQVATNPTLAFVVRDLGPAPIAWLRSLPRTIDADGIFACHGTPSDDTIYLLEDISSGWPRVRTEAEIVALLGGVKRPLVVCGHTHLARALRLAGGQLTVNPGSVGLPAYDDDQPSYHRMETYSPDASYAIVERRDGAWRVEQYRVPYDHEAAVQQARRLGRADWAEWLSTGRVATKSAAAT
ncbi:MAG: metallophosphoesterase family protein [Thermoanaerobaculales bacterium]